MGLLQGLMRRLTQSPLQRLYGVDEVGLGGLLGRGVDAVLAGLSALVAPRLLAAAPYFGTSTCLAGLVHAVR